MKRTKTALTSIALLLVISILPSSDCALSAEGMKEFASIKEEIKAQN